MSKKMVLWVIAALLLLGAAIWGPIVSNVEQARYQIVDLNDNTEIREYPSAIVAETEVSGERNEAISQGFRTIADYIFGNNTSAQKVAMTAPVTQQRVGELAMAAPVTQQGDGLTWRVRFFMPAGLTIETLPRPNNPNVKLKELSGKRFAVIRFSGVASQESLKLHTEELNRFVRGKHLNALSSPAYAFYNPPWTLPFLRRNEVMVEIAG
ncbi:MAG: heme-binding protein [Bradyrhizobium sp.]